MGATFIKPNVETAQLAEVFDMAAETNSHAARTSTPASGPKRAYRIEEFCNRFGVGRTKVYEELKLGRLRGRKIGRRTIIAEDDAESWLRRLPSMKMANGRGELA